MRSIRQRKDLVAKNLVNKKRNVDGETRSAREKEKNYEAGNGKG